MGAAIVVVADVLLKDVVEMATSEAEEVVEALSLDRADPRFGEGVRVRRPGRGLDDPGSRIAEQPIEVVSELRVAIVQQEPRLDAVVGEPHLDVASLLLHPGFVRVIGRGTNEDLSTAQVYEEQAISGPLAQRREDVLGEEVGGDEGVHVQPKELAPGRLDFEFAATAGRREQTGVTQDPADCRAPDREMQLLQLAGHAAVAPAEVLSGKADDEPPANGADARSPDGSGLAADFLLAQPAAVGLARDDTEDIVDVVTELAADAEQGGAVLRLEDDVLARRLAAQDGDLQL